MSKHLFTGAQRWEGYQPLCRPLELLGVDRRLFGLLLILFFVVWQGMSSFLVGVGLSAFVFWGFRVLTKKDPQFFSVLQSASRLPAAWYDPGLAPSSFGAYVAPSARVVHHLHRAPAKVVAQKPVSGLRARVLALVDLLSGSGGSR